MFRHERYRRFRRSADGQAIKFLLPEQLLTTPTRQDNPGGKVQQAGRSVTVASTIVFMSSAELMSTCTARAFPPAASISSATARSPAR